MSSRTLLPAPTIMRNIAKNVLNARARCCLAKANSGLGTPHTVWAIPRTRKSLLGQTARVSSQLKVDFVDLHILRRPNLAQLVRKEALQSKCPGTYKDASVSLYSFRNSNKFVIKKKASSACEGRTRRWQGQTVLVPGELAGHVRTRKHEIKPLHLRLKRLRMALLQQSSPPQQPSSRLTYKKLHK